MLTRLNDTSRPLIFLTTFLFVFAPASFAEDALEKRQLKKLFTGKTFEYERADNGRRFMIYADRDGTWRHHFLNGRRAGETQLRNWEIKKHRLCMFWDDRKSCGKVVPQDDGTYHRVSKKKGHVGTYSNFTEGDQLAVVEVEASKKSHLPDFRRVDCKPADYNTSVSAGGECLVAKTSAASKSTNNPIVLVAFTGNLCQSPGKPVRGYPETSWYMFNVAQMFQEAAVVNDVEDLVVVGLQRPGYANPDGLQSTGDHLGYCDNQTKANVEIVADALQDLKQHHNARRLVAVGHSDGGILIATILGMYPGLIDGAVTLSSALDTKLHNEMRGRQIWKRTLPPMDYVDAVAAGTVIRALRGEDDDRVPADVPQRWVESLAKNGLDAQFINVPGAGHNDLSNRQETMKALFDVVTATP